MVKKVIGEQPKAQIKERERLIGQNPEKATDFFSQARIHLQVLLELINNAVDDKKINDVMKQEVITIDHLITSAGGAALELVDEHVDLQVKTIMDGIKKELGEKV